METENCEGEIILCGVSSCIWIKYGIVSEYLQ